MEAKVSKSSKMNKIARMLLYISTLRALVFSGLKLRTIIWSYLWLSQIINYQNLNVSSNQNLADVNCGFRTFNPETTAWKTVLVLEDS
ncbi:hypothetical protein ABEB36_007104 [Hypothenemus hampei]|uniref:Uncharacterized protein n=1 Tax=Hypothenemus hampei TaxID=57062 RepID=A0ABD1EST7_HYPHA